MMDEAEKQEALSVLEKLIDHLDGGIVSKLKKPADAANDVPTSSADEDVSKMSAKDDEPESPAEEASESPKDEEDEDEDPVWMARLGLKK